MKILFSGGGTLGPVVPLLAMAEMIEAQRSDAEFLFVGTAYGPEEAFLKKQGRRFVAIPSGKLRRYVSLKNLTDFFLVLKGIVVSVQLLRKEKPDLCIAAGGFVSFPVHIAAWLLRIPTWIHQQDHGRTLTNRLLAPFATSITVALEASLRYFPAKKTEVLGNPVRPCVTAGNTDAVYRAFELNRGVPLVFVTGGGTGAQTLNELVIAALPFLENICQVIHLTGEGKSFDNAQAASKRFSHYHFLAFSHDMPDLYAAASLVIGRGGFATLTEIAALGLPALIMPQTGLQDWADKNVTFLQEQGAIVKIDEQDSSGEEFAEIIKTVLADEEGMMRMKAALQQAIPIASKEKVCEVVQGLVRNKEQGTKSKK